MVQIENGNYGAHSRESLQVNAPVRETAGAVYSISEGSSSTKRVVMVASAVGFSNEGIDVDDFRPYNFLAFELDKDRLRSWTARTVDLLPNENFRVSAELVGAWNSFELAPLDVELEFYEGDSVLIWEPGGGHFTNGYPFEFFEAAMTEQIGPVGAVGDDDFVDWVDAVAVHHFRYAKSLSTIDTSADEEQRAEVE